MASNKLLLMILSAAGLSLVAGCPTLPDPDTEAETVAGLACIDVEEDATACPAAEDVDLGAAFVPFSCDDDEIVSISGEGAVENTAQDGEDLACCYDAELIDTTPGSDCDVGRPYRESEINVLAEVVARADWGGQEPAPDTRGALDPTRAAAWALAGAAEHASIAAFSKLALELLAHGAPASLLRAVHQAGLDEIDHTERCFALAHRFGGTAVGPGPIPFTQPIQATRALADIAADAVREGCIGETTGAVLARAAAEAATDHDVRAALTSIADDEDRHAALSWQVVAWAVRTGGAAVRAAVGDAFVAPVSAGGGVAELALRAAVDPAVLRAAAQFSLTEVVRPAARALMAA